MAAGFADKALNVLGGPLRSASVELLQVNLGYLCNMSCRHCHVEGGPSGPGASSPGSFGNKDQMAFEDIAHVLGALDEERISTLDLTGGAPELHPSFKEIVSSARKMDKRVIVRTNLTVLLEPGMEDMPEFFADNGVELVASLPCYSLEGVDRVRGPGAFRRSIAALIRLNALGYGEGDSGLVLNLVYNPQGAFLAPPQQALEADYKRELKLRQGVFFNSLYTFANMPIGRFRRSLERSGQLVGYLKQLTDAFNPCALSDVMCRRLLSVGPDGRLFDCDFNQALGLSLTDGLPGHISQFDYDALSGRVIKVDEHCHGCVAGQGST